MQSRERNNYIFQKLPIKAKDYKINTSMYTRHADFSSEEVERIMKTVDTVILLVDSSEGPMPRPDLCSQIAFLEQD